MPGRHDWWIWVRKMDVMPNSLTQMHPHGLPGQLEREPARPPEYLQAPHVALRDSSRKMVR